MTIFCVFLIAGVGTYLIRISGIVGLGAEGKLPVGVARALRLVAPAAIGAIVANSLLLEGDGIRGFGAWHVGAAVAVIVAVWRRSMGWSMLSGVLAFAVLRVFGL